ncbi:M48 family metallopeptidase [Xylanibacter rodentium]|jgi:heat shock protein HtpX|uniref:M48 family metallopeptidase n=1 Tax=Xylanibacter rodentium TaxID=2736289 RepID=A0ABX2AQV8_9BACT|nr:M48 family metallopeptidase [Xylanibacter rodentium]NPE11552.1 M48 family metallopeptidase [Prevotella sp. PJ1A]NPE13092.1 M48 family metallopeptidase [Xylanibacter rodentium]NPE38684.1 M48 family metallopeptidase [Prevotella sp. PCJ2]
MKYVGMHTQVRRNNMMSIVLLLLFPLIILGTIWVFLALVNYFGTYYYDAHGNMVNVFNADIVNGYFLSAVPWVAGGVIIWFLIAYFSNTSMIRQATGAQPLARRDNPRVYNIVENLCMTCGMDMPQINIIDDPQLNAFASGIDRGSYTVTVTTGLLRLLNDDELTGVLAHELTHIRNRDTRLLIVSIIFVGIISAIMSMVVNMMYHAMWFGSNSRNEEKGGGLSILAIMLIGALCSGVAYFFTLLTRFAISRKREYMADAGGAELCGNPLALASALRKISGNPGLGHIGRDDIAQMYIIHPKNMAQGVMSFANSLFSTHPSTESRIKILEQF